MPSPEEKTLLDAVKSNNEGEYKRIIGDHPDLVNMVISLGKNSFSLMQLLLNGNKPVEFLQHLATHPKFDFHFMNLKNNKKYTNADAIFLYGRKDLLQSIIDMPEILKVGDELTYSRAKQILDVEEKELIATQSKTPNSITIAADKEKISAMKEMISMIREATIKQAIATDDPSLLNQLELAGCNMRDRLSTGATPFHSLADTGNEKLNNWFAYYLARTSTRVSPTQCGQSFFDKNKQLEELTQEHYAKKIKILDDSIRESMGRMEQVETLIKNK